MTEDSSAAVLSAMPLFQGLPEATLKYVADHMERRWFPKGITLLMKQERGHSILFIEKGLARVCDKSCKKNEVLIALLGPGEVIGEIHALDGEGHSADVIAALDTTCWFIEKKVFLECLQKFPDLMMNLLRLTAKRLRQSTNQIALLSTQDTPGRLARQLQILGDQCGVPTDDGGIEIPLPITQGDLAALTGTSRQSINAAFTQFRSLKAVDYRNCHFVILRPDLLEQRCR